MWSVSDGQEIARPVEKDHPIIAVAFSPDGRTAFALSRAKTMTVFDVAVRERRARLRVEDTMEVACAAFAPGGGSVAIAGRLGQHLEVDSSTGKVLRSFKLPWSSSIYEADATATAISPDGSLGLTGTYNNKLFLWRRSSGSVVRVIVGHPDEPGARIVSVCFSRDGKTAISATSKSAKAWSVATGRELWSKDFGAERPLSAAVAPDGGSVVVGLESGVSRILSAGRAEDLGALRSRAEWPNAVAFSADGKRLLSGALGLLSVRDATTGAEIRTLRVPSGLPLAVAFSPDGRTAACATGDGFFYSWDIQSSELRRSLGARSDKVTAAALSASGEIALFGFLDGSVSMFRSGGKGGGTFRAAPAGPIDPVCALAVSPDERIVAVCYGQKAIAWDLSAGRKAGELVSPAGYIKRAAFSSDGGKILVGTLDRWFLWDPKAASSSVARTAASLSSLALAPDGRTVLTGGFDGSLVRWGAETGDARECYEVAAGAVTAIAVSPDGASALCASLDATTRIVSLRDGAWIAFLSGSVFTEDANEWLAFTQDGYWDSSPSGGGLVAMVRGLECWNIDQFAIRNDRPDILVSRLGGDPRTVEHFLAQYRKRLRRLGLAEDDVASEVRPPAVAIEGTRQRGASLDLSFRASDPAFGLRSYNVYVNDVPIFGAYGKALPGRTAAKGEGASVALTERIDLCAGINKVEVSCVNSRGIESYRAVATATCDRRAKPDLYYIGFGVSDYSDDALDLRFAAADALDLGKSLRARGSRYGRILTHVFVDREATVGNIKRAKELLRGAKPEDTVVLFVAGHGMHDSGPESTYYFLTHETRLEDLRGTAAEFDLIEDILQGIAPRNKLFLMDTCESGEIDPEESVRAAEAARRGGTAAPRAIAGRGLSVVQAGSPDGARTYLFEKDRYIYNDLVRRSGAIVFSSCRGGEYSFEDERLGHGLFTHELLAALASAPLISIDELASTVARKTGELSGGLQHPTVDRDNLYQKFGL